MSDVCSSDLATVLNRSVPSYPPDAYRAREEGSVLVKAQIDALGNASDVEIVSRSGSRILDRAAMNEVRKWKFRPAIKDGRTVTSSVQVPVDYRLDEEQPDAAQSKRAPAQPGRSHQFLEARRAEERRRRKEGVQ